MEHGTRTMYNHGKCRCDDCVASNTEYVRRQRRKRDAESKHDSEGHVVGKPYSASTYNNWGCRCRRCTEANSLSCHRRRLIREAR